MKQLQNNFTTPEQSKRLLELGVPADSADMAVYIFFEPYNYKLLKHPFSIFIRDYVPDDLVEFYIPCWSVGRLIEICTRCSTLEQRQVLFFCNGDDDYYDFMSYIINVLETEIMTNHMDFSKLEE